MLVQIKTQNKNAFSHIYCALNSDQNSQIKDSWRCKRLRKYILSTSDACNPVMMTSESLWLSFITRLWVTQWQE